MPTLRSEHTTTVVWRAGLIALVVVAGLYRLPYLSAAHVDLDADEAICGLTALHAAKDGRLAVYFYGQAYNGMLACWLAAPLVAAFGEGTLPLRFVAFLFAMAAVALFARLTKREFGVRPALVATAAVALWPGGEVPLWVKMRSLPEALFFFVLTLDFASSFRQRAASGDSLPIWQSALAGAAIGIGVWCQGLVAVAAVAATVVLLKEVVKNRVDADLSIPTWLRAALTLRRYRDLQGTLPMVLRLALVTAVAASLAVNVAVAAGGFTWHAGALRIQITDGNRATAQGLAIVVICVAVLETMHLRQAESSPRFAIRLSRTLAMAWLAGGAARLSLHAIGLAQESARNEPFELAGLSSLGRNLALMARLTPVGLGAPDVAAAWPPSASALFGLAVVAGAVILGVWTWRSSRASFAMKTAALAVAMLLVLCVVNERVSDTGAIRYLMPLGICVPLLCAGALSMAGWGRWVSGGLAAAFVLGGVILGTSAWRGGLQFRDGGAWPGIVNELRERGVRDLAANYWVAYPIEFTSNESITAVPYDHVRFRPDVVALQGRGQADWLLGEDDSKAEACLLKAQTGAYRVEPLGAYRLYRLENSSLAGQFARGTLPDGCR
jgi:hypothetical protein